MKETDDLLTDLLTMLPYLEQGKTLFCPVSHAYLKPLGNGEVERTPYLMESEWAKPRTIRIDELRETGIRVYAEAKNQHVEYLKLQDELKGYDVVLPFGKHKGKRFSEVPKDYVEWVANQKWKDSKFPDMASNYLQMQEMLDSGYFDGDSDSDFSYDWEVEDE